MITECEECGRKAAIREVYEKYHTDWKCRVCGCEFTYSLQGIRIRKHGDTYTDPEKESQ